MESTILQNPMGIRAWIRDNRTNLISYFGIEKDDLHLLFAALRQKMKPDMMQKMEGFFSEF